MQLLFPCPVCESASRNELTADSTKIECEGCHWQRDLSRDDLVNDQPQRCLCCGCDDLWRQKDFPQRLGLLFVVVGGVLSTIAWARHEPIWAIGILMAFALVDMVLYSVMKDVLVCYRCAARHRRVEIQEDHPRFNLELNERYRQESIRLEQAQSGNQ